MNIQKNELIRSAVRKNYGKIATSEKTGCCAGSSCCGAADEATAANIAMGLGYSDKEVVLVPEAANMGLGCGNPQAIAALKQGEVVLDLGCGGGFDCFLAARAVGDKGFVIGVDMTAEMVAKARRNAEQAGFKNVDFRLGELENLPVSDGIVDVIISNCVINLSPEKKKVFSEAFRVLKPGGRLAISDIVAIVELPDNLKKDMMLHVGCVAGASSIQDLESMLLQAGFAGIRIEPKMESQSFIRNWVPGSGIEEYVASATIAAVKG